MIYFDFYVAKFFLLLFLSFITLLPILIGFALWWIVATDCGFEDANPDWKSVVWAIFVLIMFTVSMRSDIGGELRTAWVNRWNQTVLEFEEKERAQDAKSSAVRVEEKTSIARFKLVSWNPPKHFYVTLKGEDGSVHESVYVSKHCNNHVNLIKGEDYSLKVTTYKMSNDPVGSGLRYQFHNLSTAFCS